jgi:hypothetical protein
LIKTSIICDYCKENIEGEYYNLISNRTKPNNDYTEYVMMFNAVKEDICLDCFKKVKNELKNS